MMRRPRRRSGQRDGQALIELCFIAPVILLLFIGVYTTAAFINDRQIAGQSTRAGARLGAEIGNAGYFTGAARQFACQTTAQDPCGVDAEILRSTLTVARGFSNVPTIAEVDIYEACLITGGVCDTSPQTGQCPNLGNGNTGAYVSGQPVDVYKPDGTGKFVINGSPTFTLDQRTDAHPRETPIGVRIVYTFQGSAPMTFFNFTTSVYTSMCLAPVEPGG